MEIHCEGKRLRVGGFYLPNIDWEFSSPNSCTNTKITFDIMFHYELNQSCLSAEGSKGIASWFYTSFLLNNHSYIEGSVLIVVGMIISLLSFPLPWGGKRTWPAEICNISKILRDEVTKVSLIFTTVLRITYRDTDVNTVWGKFKFIINRCI